MQFIVALVCSLHESNEDEVLRQRFTFKYTLKIRGRSEK